MTTSFCSSGLKKPAFRIVVNTPTTLGSIGLTTGLDPSMTLGCGGYGGNITSDNISPRHLLNIKRLAYQTSPAPAMRPAAPAATPLPRAPEPPRVPGGLAAESLARRIDQFLSSRGYTPPAPSAIAGAPASAASAGSPQIVAVPAPTAADALPAPSGPPGPECSETSRVRLRRRRSAGRSAGAQDRHRGANHRHTGGAGPRRAAPHVRAGELAIVRRFRRLLLRRLGLRLTGDELGCYALYPSNREDLAPDGGGRGARRRVCKQHGQQHGSAVKSERAPRPTSLTRFRERQHWTRVAGAGRKTGGGKITGYFERRGSLRRPESRGSAQYDVTCMAADSGSSRDQLGPRGRVRFESKADRSGGSAAGAQTGGAGCRSRRARSHRRTD